MLIRSKWSVFPTVHRPLKTRMLPVEIRRVLIGLGDAQYLGFLKQLPHECDAGRGTFTRKSIG